MRELPFFHTEIQKALLEKLQSSVFEAIFAVQSGHSGEPRVGLRLGQHSLFVCYLHSAEQQRIAHEQLASVQGLSPEIVVVDPAGKWLVRRFINRVPMTHDCWYDQHRIHDLMDRMMTLHQKLVFNSPVKRVEQLLAMTEQLLKQNVWPNALRRLQVLLVALQERCERNVKQCAIHGDLHPDNVMFDGQRNWLIDWECSGVGDPLLDLATVLDFLVPCTKQQEVLEYYKQCNPWTHDDDRRLLDMKFVANAYYSLSFLLLTTRMDGSISTRDNTTTINQEWLEQVFCNGTNELSSRTNCVRFAQQLLRKCLNYSRDY